MIAYRTAPACISGKRTWIAALALLLGTVCGVASGASDPLKSGFQNPPSSARPRVWWHWMNGNITKEGIKLDLEWMHRIGLAGFQNFDAALATPQVVDHRLAYMTPEWKDAFKYATTLAGQFGMEEAIAGSPGWSETGGPWVPPSEGMKKYVWSETAVEGGKQFSGTLAKPPGVTGAFQNTGVHDMIAAPPGAKPIPQFYADGPVVAYKVAESDVPADSFHPMITFSGGTPDTTLFADGDLVKAAKLPIPSKAGDLAWVQYRFDAPTTIRSITLAMNDVDAITGMITGIVNPERTLEISDDGQNFRAIAKLPDGGVPQHTVSFPPITAKFFRVTFKKPPPFPVPAWLSGLDPSSLGIKMSGAPVDYDITELVLRPGARVNRFEDKAAFSTVPDVYQLASAGFVSSDVVRMADEVDLTSKVNSEGKLNWAPPAGKWIVIRFGYSLIGITNHPATAEATGLEVDKLNHTFVKNYMNGYLDSYKATVGPDSMGKHGIQYVITDSWEAGPQNWTDDMLAQFKKRRGYDPLPWLPVLTGQVVESSTASDNFLWDFRKTIADLTADEHYGQVEASIKERGMGHYGESHESGRAFIADGMEVKKLNEVPMSAMWTQLPGVNAEQYAFNADDRESASVAHIYGQNLAAAESLTAGAAPWAWSPATLKPTADRELLNGINRFVIHESAHQPLLDKAPGLTLGPFGQWFNRNETWAEQAKPWIDYLARSSYLLQQGRFGADILYFYGEDSNLTAIFAAKHPDVPAGYGFDYVNADALIHEIKASPRGMSTASGMNYRLLVLDPYSKHMSLPVLRAIHSLVERGATISGEKPTDSPSLADDAAEFKKLNDELFGDGSGVHTVGKGKVYAGPRAEEALKALNLAPDFENTKPKTDTSFLFVHRKIQGGDIYFVDNRNDRDETVDATFRIAGKAPELWYAETGMTKPASYKIAEGRTTVPLHLEPWGTVFVVFRESTKKATRTLATPAEADLATLDSQWKLSFQPGRGAPASISLDKLTAWNENSDSSVKYFSGTGTYTSTVQASPDWFKTGSSFWIDLGDVKNLAEVSVNGKPQGQVWHAPYRLEITSALKPGKNEITIKVTNAWVNRLIGDQQPGVTTQYTYADVKPYKADSPLLPSGLLGPVKITSLSNP